MQDCRLIIIEGLMGSGKSTMATQIAMELQNRNIPYRYHWEAELPHPVKIRPKLGRYTLLAEEQIERSLLKWKAFVDCSQKTDRVTVLDAQLFHVNVTNIFKQNGTREQIETYIQNLTDIIQPLNPRLVYFFQNDIEEALRKVGDERGERWIESHIKEKTGSLFAQEHGLSGYDGMVQFCKLYRELTDHLFKIVDIKKLSIENSAKDWKSYNEQVFEFMSLAPYDESLQLGNAHLNHTKEEIPSRMCFDNQTDRFFVVYDWLYKKPMAQYRFEILPREKRFHDALKGERYRLHDANTGEIVQDVLVCQSTQTVPINPSV